MAMNTVEALAVERHVFDMGSRKCPETGETIRRHRMLLKIEEENVPAFLAAMRGAMPNHNTFSTKEGAVGGFWRLNPK